MKSVPLQSKINNLIAGFILLGGVTLFTSNRSHLIAGVVGLLVCAIMFLVHKMEKENPKKGHAEFAQAFFVFVLLMGSILLVAQRYSSFLSKKVTKIGLGVIMITAFVIFLYDCYILIKRILACKIKVKVVESIAVLLVIGICTYLSVEIFGFWCRWDSYAYLYDFKLLAIEDINSLSGLRICNHISYAYALIAFVINSVVRDMEVTLLAINLVFYLLSVAFIYTIIGVSVPKTKRVYKLLGTVLYAISPFTMGLVGMINLDYFLMCVIVFYLYFCIKDLRILQLLAIICVIYSKETGVLIAASFVGVNFLYNMIAKYKATKKITLVDEIVNTNIVAIFFLGLAWLFAYSKGSWTGTNTDAGMELAESVKFNIFDVNLSYISDRLQAFFFTNFNWLLISITVLLTIMYMIQNKRSIKRMLTRFFSNKFNWYLITLLVINTAFNLVFVTYNHARYGMANTIVITCFFVKAVALLRKDVVKNSILAIAIVILGIQSFYSVDPVMKLMFPTESIGSASLSATKDTVLKRTDFLFSDAVVYNRQANYYDVALEMLLDEMNFTTDDTLVFSNEFKATTVGGEVDSLYLLGGYGYHYTDRPYYVSWNEKTSEIYRSRSQKNKLKIIYMNKKYKEKDLFKQQSFYIKMPWGDTLFDEVISKDFDISESYTVSYRGWVLEGYKLQKKSK